MFVSQIRKAYRNCPLHYQKYMQGMKTAFHLALKITKWLEIIPRKILSLEKWASTQSGISKYIRVINWTNNSLLAALFR